MSLLKKNNSDIIIGIVLILLGIISSFASLTVIPDIWIWNSVLFVFGLVLFLVGIRNCFKGNITFRMYLPAIIGFFLVFFLSSTSIEFAKAQNNPSAPLLYIKKTEYGNVTKYKKLFYSIYEVEQENGKSNYLLDTTNKYTIETVPNTIYNLNNGKLKEMINYVGVDLTDKDNVRAFIRTLPLTEYCTYSDVDLDNKGLIIDYNFNDITDKDIYVKRALVFNSVSLYTFVDDIEYVTFNLKDNSYTVRRNVIVEEYPKIHLLREEDKINKKNFEEYVEEKMEDEQFVNEIFVKLFEIQ